MVLNTIGIDVNEGRFIGTSGRQCPNYQDHTEARSKDSRVSCREECKGGSRTQDKRGTDLENKVNSDGLRGSGLRRGVRIKMRTTRSRTGLRRSLNVLKTYYS